MVVKLYSPEEIGLGWQRFRLDTREDGYPGLGDHLFVWVDLNSSEHMHEIPLCATWISAARSVKTAGYWAEVSHKTTVLAFRDFGSRFLLSCWLWRFFVLFIYRFCASLRLTDSLSKQHSKLIGWFLIKSENVPFCRAAIQVNKNIITSLVFRLPLQYKTASQINI